MYMRNRLGSAGTGGRVVEVVVVVLLIVVWIPSSSAGVFLGCFTGAFASKT